MPTLFAPSRQRFAYGHGRVGVLQQCLLTQDDVQRLVAARNAAELTRLIGELKISAYVEYVHHPHRYINNVERWLQRELRSMVDEVSAPVFDILWIKDDAALLSYLLKQKLGLTSDLSAEPHVGATAFDPGDLRLIVQGGESSRAPAPLVAFIRQMTADHLLTPQAIDTRVAQFVVEQQLRLARSASPAIVLYVAHHIDLLNIRTARRLGRDDKPAEHLLRGGEIDVTRFSLDKEELASLVRSSSLGTELADSIQATNDSSVALERGLAKAIALDLARMRSAALTLEPIFAFGAIAQSQLKLLRTILIGKSAHLSSSELQRLLPPFLSASPYA